MASLLPAVVLSASLRVSVITKSAKNSPYQQPGFIINGDRVTLPSGKYELYNINYWGNGNKEDRVIYDEVHIYSEKNGYRMPDYHRLDIGLNFTKVKRKGISNWSIGVYNAYNRQNAYYIFFKKTSNGETKLYQQSLFPILLNFGYSFIF